MVAKAELVEAEDTVASSEAEPEVAVVVGTELAEAEPERTMVAEAEPVKSEIKVASSEADPLKAGLEDAMTVEAEPVEAEPGKTMVAEAEPVLRCVDDFRESPVLPLLLLVPDPCLLLCPELLGM